MVLDARQNDGVMPAIELTETNAMPDNERRYQAYQLLRELDSMTSTMMNQVAYGHVDGEEWRELCNAHRQAFEDWMCFAETLLKAGDRAVDDGA